MASFRARCRVAVTRSRRFKPPTSTRPLLCRQFPSKTSFVRSLQRRTSARARLNESFLRRSKKEVGSSIGLRYVPSSLRVLKCAFGSNCKEPRSVSWYQRSAHSTLCNRSVLNVQAIDFSVHLAMSDDPPVRLELAVQDPSSARNSMLNMTWAFVAFRRQLRLAQYAGASSATAPLSDAAAHSAGKPPASDRCDASLISSAQRRSPTEHIAGRKRKK